MKSGLFNLQPPGALPSAAMVAAVGVGLWLAIFPTLFRRGRPDRSQAFATLVTRVRQLRQGKFPARYAHINAVKTRAKLVAEARRRLDKKPFFTDRQPP